MMSKILITVVLVSIFSIPRTTAQQPGNSISQTVTLQLEPIIQISAVTTSDVTLGFKSINNYISGVESGTHHFTINSNKDYQVSVRTNAAAFSYNGSSFPAPQMPVDNILFLSVNENSTGGYIANSFSNYASLSNTPQHLLMNCKNGADKSFSVTYKANPGAQYPAGDYTVGVVYTATQP